MRLTFLGTGTSFGIPVIGCRCSVCTSEDPRNRRTRHALLVEDGDETLLVDTPPELRIQLVRQGVLDIDHVFLTHPHADHVHGIDDLRIFTLRADRPLPVYAAREHEAGFKRRFAYIWGPEAAPAPGTSIPDLELRSFEDRERMSLGGMAVTPIAFPHGYMNSYGFRVGELGVIVDAKNVPEDAVELLSGLRVLVLNALWFGNPHPTHFNVEEALAVADRLGAGRTFLTHLTHRLDHQSLVDALPDGVEPAYDGLSIEV
jgi:phosphoribosyl 1,2-cyclic phosphate phosphodiesterase